MGSLTQDENTMFTVMPLPCFSPKWMGVRGGGGGGNSE